MAETKKEIMPAITAQVLGQLQVAQENRTIVIPPNYSPENALKSAYLILQGVKTKDGQPVLTFCDKTSITEALFNMVIQGLNPAKNQCYFIPYGDKLTLSRSYLGTIAVTKRIAGVKDVKAYPIYEGDKFSMKFDFKKGILEVTEYEPAFDNIKSEKLRGAFAIVIGEDSILHTEVMNMEQINAAWNMGNSNGKSPAHKNFTDEMAKKSVINRACKRYYGTSDDSAILMIDEEVNPVDRAFIEVEQEDRIEKPVIDLTPKEIEAPIKDTTTSKKKHTVPPAVPEPAIEMPNEDELPF